MRKLTVLRNSSTTALDAAAAACQLVRMLVFALLERLCIVLQTLEELAQTFGYDEHLVRLYRLAQQFERVHSQEAQFDMTSPANEDRNGQPVNGQPTAR